MPAPFPASVASALADIKNTVDGATGSFDDQVDLYELLVGMANVFGAAALANAGAAPGDVLRRDQYGRLSNEDLPDHIDRTSLLINAAVGIGTDSRHAVNARLLLTALSWLTTPDTNIYRDEHQNAGGIVASASSAAPTVIAVGVDLSRFYKWRIRYDPPGAAPIQQVTVENTLGGISWTAVNPGRAGDTLHYRQQPGSVNARRLELYAENGGYRILSVRGINPIPNVSRDFTSRFPSLSETTGTMGFGRITGQVPFPRIDGVPEPWASDYLYIAGGVTRTAGAGSPIRLPLTQGFIDITEDEFRRHRIIEIEGQFTFTHRTDLWVRFAGSENGIMTFRNSCNKPLNVSRLGWVAGNNSAFIQPGVTASVGRAGVNVVDLVSGQQISIYDGDTFRPVRFLRFRTG